MVRGFVAFELNVLSVQLTRAILKGADVVDVMTA